jgi:hypothetical protein
MFVSRTCCVKLPFSLATRPLASFGVIYGFLCDVYIRVLLELLDALLDLLRDQFLGLVSRGLSLNSMGSILGVYGYGFRFSFQCVGLSYSHFSIIVLEGPGLQGLVEGCEFLEFDVAKSFADSRNSVPYQPNIFYFSECRFTEGSNCFLFGCKWHVPNEHGVGEFTLQYVH